MTIDPQALRDELIRARVPDIYDVDYGETFQIDDDDRGPMAAAAFAFLCLILASLIVAVGVVWAWWN